MHITLPSLAATALFVLTAVSPAQDSIKKGLWDKNDVPDGWVIHNTRHYQVQSQAGMEKAERLGKHMDTMLATYWKLFRPDKSAKKHYAIKLFKDKKEFQRYGAPPGAGAYFSRSEKEMVCYDTGKWMDEEEPEVPITGGEDSLGYREMERIYQMDILGAAAHEGWHQYFAWYVGSWVSLPSWINEGMGDYFYTASPQYTPGKRPKAELGRMNGMRLPMIRAAIKQDRHHPLKQFLYYEQRQYYSDPGVCYAQGWALCQFLLHSKNRRYRQIIPAYLFLVRSDTNMEAVTKKAFQGIDLDELEEEWKAWCLEQELPHEKKRRLEERKRGKDKADG